MAMEENQPLASHLSELGLFIIAALDWGSHPQLHGPQPSDLTLLHHWLLGP